MFVHMKPVPWPHSSSEPGALHIQPPCPYESDLVQTQTFDTFGDTSKSGSLIQGLHHLIYPSLD